jgi:signal peptidase
MIVSGLVTHKPSVFGYRVLYVVSGSMEPTIKTNQFVLAHTIDAKDVEVGDIVAYNRDGRYIVHRIIDEEDDEDGTVLFQFQGDNNNIPDESWVTESQITYEIIAY